MSEELSSPRSSHGLFRTQWLDRKLRKSLIALWWISIVRFLSGSTRVLGDSSSHRHPETDTARRSLEHQGRFFYGVGYQTPWQSAPPILACGTRFVIAPTRPCCPNAVDFLLSRHGCLMMLHREKGRDMMEEEFGSLVMSTLGQSRGSILLE